MDPHPAVIIVRGGGSFHMSVFELREEVVRVKTERLLLVHTIENVARAVILSHVLAP